MKSSLKLFLIFSISKAQKLNMVSCKNLVIANPRKELFHVYLVIQQIFAKCLCLNLHDPWSLINSPLFSLRLNKQRDHWICPLDALV